MARRASALVSWKPVSGAIGYKVFWGKSSRNYNNVADAGNRMNFRVQNLRKGTTYFFAAKAYTGSKTSIYSNEVDFRP